MAVGAQAAFTQQEQDAVMAYWSVPGRYTVTAPADVEKVGPWQVRLTSEGSTWLWNYNRARGVGKGPPTQDAGAQSESQKVWEKWIDAKVEFDRWAAAVAAANANEKALGRKIGKVPPQPADPGPAPLELIALAGDPPKFAAAVAPLRHIVKFDDGFELSYVDQVVMRPRYAYFRFPQGVMSAGQSLRQMSETEISALFEEAGMDKFSANVLRAISPLEGGFDSVNTYDTGYVSVGFIQFACLAGGSGSLGSVLLEMKRTYSDAFQRDFRRMGIDVDDSAVLIVADPGTGSVVRGPDAAMKIINDKRLIAVFGHAGSQSRAFRMAQVRVAKNQYYPAEDPISLVLPDGVLFGKVADIIKSEAGMATLTDRKVNTGKIDPLVAVATRVAKERGVKTLEELAAYERDIVAALRYRKDYLADPVLSQPPTTTPPPRSYNSVSRSGSRKARKPRSK
jgi:hypothetical protein